MTVSVTMHLGYTLSPLNLMRRDSKGCSFLGVHLQLLKSRKVDDIRGAVVANKDSSGIEPFYHKHYN